MKDGVHLVYCDRPGCGKEAGAQRWENGKVVEEEWVNGIWQYSHLDEEGVITKVTHYCCKECYEHRDEFLTPEEVADDTDE